MFQTTNKAIDGRIPRVFWKWMAWGTAGMNLLQLDPHHAMSRTGSNWAGEPSRISVAGRC